MSDFQVQCMSSSPITKLKVVDSMEVCVASGVSSQQASQIESVFLDCAHGTAILLDDLDSILFYSTI